MPHADRIPAVTNRTDRDTRVVHLRVGLALSDRVAAIRDTTGGFTEAETLRALINAGLAAAERKAQR